ncbi:MAG: hypothetical protein LBK95_11080 [Bifidobacteriaceae bacterium]|jgi:hypothetical protein|nr:hypothetical protein [Bifidobacteriaceae bacterium]
MTGFTPARAESPGTVEQSRERRLRFVFTGLVESPAPFKASGLARENLYNAVTEESPGFLFGLVESPFGNWGWVEGPVTEDTIEDVRYAFGPIGMIDVAEAIRPLPTPVLEVAPIRTEPDDVFAGLEPMASDAATPPFRKMVGGRDAVPQGVQDPMWDFFQCAKNVPGAAILTLLSPASDLEQSMADSYWRPAFHGGSNTEWQMWRGTKMIRARSFLCSATGRIPTRMRAERKIMSQRIGFTELSEADRAELLEPTADTLNGFAVPFGVYRSLVALPAAGVGRHVPGVPTVKPPAMTVPLDVSPTRTAPSVRLGEAVASDQTRFVIGQSPEDKRRHTQIIGQPGSGKTTMLVNDCVQYTANGIGFVYLDPHGDGSRRVLMDAGSDCRSRLWLVNHGDADHVVPVNPLAAPTAELFARAVSLNNDMLRRWIDPKGEGFWGERATRTFTLVATACWHTGDVSLPMVAEIVSDQELCRRLAKRVEPVRPALARQLMAELGNLSSSGSRDLFSWMGSRLGQIRNSPALARILGTGANAIDMAGLMDRGEGLLVDLGASHLGPDAVRLLEMSYLVLIDLAKNRRERRDRAFGAVVDEAHTVQIGPLASLLDEGRKFGVFVEAAHQRLDQLDRPIADALEADAGTFVCLRTGIKDGARASIRLRDWPVGDLTRLPAFQAAAVVCRDGAPTQPFTLFIDPPKTYSGTDAARREEFAQQVAAETVTALSVPYAALAPVSADNVAGVLARRADPSRHARIAALGDGQNSSQALLTRIAGDITALAEAKRAAAPLDAADDEPF